MQSVGLVGALLIGELLLSPPLAMSATVASAGTSAAADAESFSTCIARLEAAARLENISEAVIEEVLGGITISERVLELDRSQPEFTQTFANYFNKRVTEQRVRKGRELLIKHRTLLDAVQTQYGVPPHYLLAFWGLETNFGSYLGNMSTTDSLATLACDERRSSYFTAEMMSALKIIDAGHVEPENMTGSWAGAMGHVQFMPTSYLRYAVDNDADGRLDLWNSTADAMASAGNFLQALGWQRGLRWGREVSLPDGFDYTLAQRSNRQPLSEWRSLRVSTAMGTPLPQADIEAAILVPAGHQGPAFIVYENFNIIMGWNRSEFYALAVGHLADRIAGGGGLYHPPPDNALRFSNTQLTQIQLDLIARGYDPGDPDGILGPSTRRAVSRFQRDNAMIADGFLDAEVVSLLQSALPR